MFSIYACHSLSILTCGDKQRAPGCGGSRYLCTVLFPWEFVFAKCLPKLEKQIAETCTHEYDPGNDVAVHDFCV